MKNKLPDFNFVPVDRSKNHVLDLGWTTIVVEKEPDPNSPLMDIVFKSANEADPKESGD